MIEAFEDVHFMALLKNVRPQMYTQCFIDYIINDNNNKLDYLKTSLKQVILGNYSEDSNLLGTLGQPALGFVGLDMSADIRDLMYDITNWKLTPSHALQTATDTLQTRTHQEN